ncbi:MAG TPA: TIGR00266 family protein [Euryarchaeota archaeon]|nr:TIGR00266 family protein [Euryarchaeota archaeon]
MKYSITGDNLQLLNIELMPNEKVYSEAGSMVFMSGNVVMEARAKGGLMAGLKRKMTGESFFVTEFFASSGAGLISFGGPMPGKIRAIDLNAGGTWLLQKDAFLCAENSVQMDIAFQRKLGATFFGGEGFILQQLSGSGTAFISATGDLIEMDLQPGQVLKISTGNVVGWQSTVTYDIQAVGGIKTAFFGGEGLFVTTLTGPGKVLLQSMTASKLAMSIHPFLPKDNR